MLEYLIEQLDDGKVPAVSEFLKIAESVSLQEICQSADQIRKKMHANSFDLCSIMNAKSGKCSENCKFCAQSSHYSTAIETYECVDQQEALSLAEENEAHGIHRFSLVTAGRSVANENLKKFSEIYLQLSEKTNLSLCASMGFLTTDKAKMLRESGVSRYHCNLEASKSYFPHVCTTHTWDEKVETLRIARAAGMDICSGGIIGMGETRQQRFELALELRELGANSIPINILSPIPNTPFAELEPISVDEILLTIAIFRIINPAAVIRMAGGRGVMGDRQEQCFQAGANGAIVGDYLTTVGQNLATDLAMFRRLGFDLSPAAKN